jgi:hypothetical protein
MLLLSGMGEATKKHVKAVAQQEHGGGGSNRRRTRRGENKRASGHLCTTGINMTGIFGSKLYFCFSSSALLLLDLGDFSGPDWLSEHVILGHD